MHSTSTVPLLRVFLLFFLFFTIHLPIVKSTSISSDPKEKDPIMKIAHGVRTINREFPHYALLFDESESYYFCGGALINARTILTAAHCCVTYEYIEEQEYYIVAAKEASKIKVGLGQNEISLFESFRTVKEIIIHENYNISNLENDIALLILEDSVEESESFRYAEINKVAYPKGKSVWATGFGLKENQLAPSVMNKVFMPVQPMEMCYWGNIRPKDSIQVCVGDGKKDTCSGDSGGSLVFVDSLNSKRWTSVGIVSYGPDSKCGTYGNYGVYTNVTFYYNWIWNNSEGGIPPDSLLDSLEYLSDKLNDTRTCFGIYNNDSSVCSGRGECYSTDLCDCSFYFSGEKCTSLSSYSIAFVIAGICVVVTFLGVIITCILSLICFLTSFKK